MSFQDVGIGSKPTSGAKNQSESALFQANTALAAFRRLVDAIGTSKDTPDHRLKLFVFPNFISPPFLLLSYYYHYAGEVQGNVYWTCSGTPLLSSTPSLNPISHTTSMYAALLSR